MNFLPEMKKNDFVFPSHMTYSVLQLELFNMVPKAFLIRCRVSILYFLKFTYCVRLKVRTISNLVKPRDYTSCLFPYERVLGCGNHIG